MLTKCIKIPIEYSKDNILKSEEFYKELRDIQYKSWRACNRALTYFYMHDMENIMLKESGKDIKSDKELYGKTYGSWIENRMNEIMKGVLSNNVAQTRQYISNRYGQDRKNGLLKGNVSLSEIKRNMPIIIHAKAFKIIDIIKGLGVEVSFFNLNKQRELGVKKIKFLFPKIHSSEKSILKRLVDKSYKQGIAQLSFNERKKKWLLTISYSFEKRIEELDEDLVMGIDLGISKITTFSILNAKTKEYIQMNFKDKFVDGKELIHYRQKLEARRRELSIASKYTSKNNLGHGYKTKMQSVNMAGDKYNRFKETYNHKVSRFIIEIALRYRVKNIQMEDLSGFSEHQTESLLGNWSYYDLQNKIAYKAEELGINIIFIDPKYTSQRCNKCGNINSKNRNCKENQEKFECIRCGYKENADINASMNIAIPNIENIINNTIKIK
ncbi:IS200/IS605 family element transposase accessory protein TnpB [Clostridium botulinum]|nr:IS200/IS605 family element transposase accessory protein TnpB [Clostridium botulinum]NFP30855.1 IS200/IS605 family element transposase accessory protein TnpB [Clostridium botulinum]